MNKKIILQHLLVSDDFVSGEALSRQYGISRQAIWKQINALMADGYQIESLRRKGYRLLRDQQISKNSLAHLVFKTTLFETVKYLSEVDSTNSYAKRQADQLATALIVAAEQTAGRGRLGRTWLSDGANSLCFSMLLRPQIAPHSAAMLTQVAAAALLRAIVRQTALSIQIKWPNDLICNGKKVAGILTEMSSELNAVEYVVIGVGLNVGNTDFKAELASIATSLAANCQAPLSRLALLEEFVAYFGDYYQSFLQTGDLAFIVDDLNNWSTVVNRSVWLLANGERRPAEAKKINRRGQLIVEVDGQLEAVHYGEVSVRLNDDRAAH